MTGGSKSARNTRSSRDASEEEELSAEEYEGVTGYLTADKRLAAERNVAKSIREALGSEDTKYNGQRKDFRKFYDACCENLEDLGIENLQQCVESESLANADEDTWDSEIAKVDRTFAYQAIRGAMTDNAKHLTKSPDKNGAVLLQYFWKLWAKSTLTNTVAALGELLNLKVNKHSNPTPTFKRIEDIFKDYFDNLETIKTAFLYRVVDKEKYKDILTSLDTKSNMPSFAKLSDQLEKHWL